MAIQTYFPGFTKRTRHTATMTTGHCSIVSLDGLDDKEYLKCNKLGSGDTN